MNEKTTTVARSWKTTIGYLIGGIAAAGVSVILFATIVSGAITAGIALIPGVVAVVLLVMAKGGAAEAPCPACSTGLTGLATGSNDGVLCPQCLMYCEGKRGRLWATDPARVADSPLFGAVLPARFQLPPGCCICGSPATRRDPITVQVQRAGSAAGVLAVTGMTGGAVTGTPGSTRFTVEVPHCDAHKDGASLGSIGGDQVKIRFRSHPYLRAFCLQNHVKPA